MNGTIFHLVRLYYINIHMLIYIYDYYYYLLGVLYETVSFSLQTMLNFWINTSYQDWLGQNGMADYRKIESAFQERGNYLHTFILLYLTFFFFWSIDARIKKLIEDIGRMSNDINTLKEEISQLKQSKKDTNTTTSKLTSSKGHKTKDEEVDYQCDSIWSLTYTIEEID